MGGFSVGSFSVTNYPRRGHDRLGGGAGGRARGARGDGPLLLGGAPMRYLRPIPRRLLPDDMLVFLPRRAAGRGESRLVRHVRFERAEGGRLRRAPLGRRGARDRVRGRGEQRGRPRGAGRGARADRRGGRRCSFALVAGAAWCAARCTTGSWRWADGMLRGPRRPRADDWDAEGGGGSPARRPRCSGALGLRQRVLLAAPGAPLLRADRADAGRARARGAARGRHGARAGARGRAGVLRGRARRGGDLPRGGSATCAGAPGRRPARAGAAGWRPRTPGGSAPRGRDGSGRWLWGFTLILTVVIDFGGQG